MLKVLNHFYKHQDRHQDPNITFWAVVINPSAKLHCVRHKLKPTQIVLILM